MGNCLATLVYQPKKHFGDLPDGDAELVASRPIRKNISAPYNRNQLDNHRTKPHSQVPPNYKLQSRKVHYVVPRVTQPAITLVHNNKNLNTRKVKVVITKEQLELLLHNAKNFQAKDSAVQFSGRFRLIEGCQKWKPTLATIPEVHIF
ncbi:hypothetical protein O6P43_031369 [Quillaja saponaria]|uniref:Uncharacterized protein n=1 Tax=Quillaja saponaria TaxID=32244 RepID=A0AAD7KUR8_QUISA|nr:hypothetical protein O6P43_031369 [Quillaja saponaria]